ncbi:LCP family protein [Terrisporobacter petrolearius]|uniref:LCP family protein n=1 Tax=Terrisporobacter petrolearius TaxID=1460447 RepID=UPI0031CCCDF5
MKKKILISIILIIIFPIILNNSVFAKDIDSYTEKEIYNILLIGKDGIGDKTSRADTMIILTIDNKNKALKLTSIARDTLVYIPGKGYDKVNHSFAYGGCDLLLKTINYNFNLNLKDYAVVDFKSFVDVINVLGGVEVNIEDREVDGLNKVIDACYGLEIENKGNNIEYITSSGNHLLNGYQALAYCRLRKIDNCFYRDGRQRKVLESLAYKLSKVSVFKYPELIKILLKYVNVSVSPDKILDLAIISRDLTNYKIKQLEFPSNKYREDGTLKHNSQYVIKWEKDRNLKILHEFIYN